MVRLAVYQHATTLIMQCSHALGLQNAFIHQQGTIFQDVSSLSSSFSKRTLSTIGKYQNEPISVPSAENKLDIKFNRDSDGVCTFISSGTKKRIVLGGNTCNVPRVFAVDRERRCEFSVSV